MPAALLQSSADPTALVAPVQAMVSRLVNATGDAVEKLRLVSIARWLRVMEQLEPGRWPDVQRIGAEATRLVVGLVEDVDRTIRRLENSAVGRPLDWRLLRRHMLLGGRRHRLVALAVALDELVHALRGFR